MAYIVLAILLTGVFSQFYKIANRRRCDVFGVNLGCYLSALVLVAAYVILVEGFVLEARMVGIAVFGSVCVFGAVGPSSSPRE